MLGRRGPVGVDGLDVLGVGLALPTDQELLRERLALVHDLLRHDRLVQAARGLRGVREDHDREPADVLAGLLVADVVGLAEAERRRQHRDRWTSYDHDNVARVLAMTGSGEPDEEHLFTTDVR